MPTISKYALIFKNRLQSFEEDLEIVDITEYRALRQAKSHLKKRLKSARKPQERCGEIDIKCL